jgi:hypothetical protein
MTEDGRPTTASAPIVSLDRPAFGAPEPPTSPREDSSPSHRRRRVGWAITIAALAVTLSLVTVTVTGPRVFVRWQAAVSTANRLALEQRHDLRNGRQDDPQDDRVWRYELGDWSREAVAALIDDPSVADTQYIDRFTYEVDEATVTVGTRVPSILRLLPFPFSTDNRFESLWFFFHVQSLCLIVAGCVLLSGARIHNERQRQTLAVAALLAVGIAACVFPVSPSLLRMADSATYTKNRVNFETSIGKGEVPFENHLTIALLAKTYPAFGPREDAPERTFRALTRVATAWFVICALAIGVVERWSPQVVRYLALAVLAPSTLMYFGHRDFAYLSLNVAAFPLLAHGISSGSKRLEAGSALSGLGAALHAFGLLSLVGAWLGALVVRAPIGERVERILRIAAWGTAAWVGWLAIYMIVLNLGVATSHADSGSWRPLLVDEVGNRLNVAIFSRAGARDILVSGWVVGVPILVVAASLWKQHRDQVSLMLCYAIPSVLFLIFYWPPQGLGVDTGHLVGTFPAMFAAAWLCARQQRHTTVAALLLISGHLGFWRMVLDTRFVNWTLP